MKRITIIGMGLGESTLTPEAFEAAARAEVLFGAQRALDLCGKKGLAGKRCPYFLADDVARVVHQENAREFAVLVSGDVGFYSAATALAKAFGETCEMRFVPGISSMSALFARLQLPWQDAAFVSVHGRGMNVVDTVRRNRLTFALTDAGSVNGLGAALCKAGFGNRMVHIGKNLGMEQEHVYTRTAADLARETLPSLTVLLFVNEDFDDRTPCGLPDSCFARLPDIPMTKSEIRALVLSRLKLRPADLCWDIGAGSGSVTAEAALHAWRGHVYAVERREASLSLIEENCDALHIGNVTVVCGEAPKALGGLPAPDAVLIGGSGGNLPAIFSAVLRANPNARIVVTAITPETVSAALAAFQTAGMDPEILQINVSRGRKAGGLHLMVAQNPVTILSAERQA